ncbi:hypothetical protein PT974_01718 [Cladobotryum mycophilum]|uniref:Zn(2)-C6 fungal-type domain-containing protein n=1 Tax=Cladobotryum mycophilum TaxID=491253 RepID=A0ABR0SWB3_9HYPO
MPNSRVKSCDGCRLAKARCSLSTPCSRCVKRRIQCSYAPAQLPRHKDRYLTGFRRIQPLAIATSTAKETSSDNGLNKDPSSSVCENREHVALVTATATSPSTNTDPEHGSFSDLMALMEPGGTSCHLSDLTIYSNFTQHFDMPGTLAAASTSQSLDTTNNNVSVLPHFSDPLSSSALLNFDSPMATPTLNATLFDGMPWTKLKSPEFLMTPSATNVTQFPKSLGRHLSQRRRSFHQGSLTASMLLSQLIDYTRRMADGKRLPPFIHPPCSLSHEHECPPDTPHRCLPEILAVCSSLTKLFYSGTQVSHAFVWQQILRHLRQMYGEYNGYDEQRVLQALQASVIYTLLYSQCTESVSSEDAAWLVSTTEKFARRLYIVCSWGLDATYLCISRSKWVFVESMNRVGCLLYLADLLLHVDAKSPSKGECPEFIDVPLPCARELWQPISDKEWKKRYQEDISSKMLRGRQGLTMGNLFSLRQSLVYGENLYTIGKPDFADELAEWVESVDELSMLLWMAFTLEGEGQAQICQK